MINNTSRLIVLIFLFLVCLQTTAQVSETDSLKRLLSANPVDTERVDLLNALSRSLLNSNPDTSVITASSSKTLAERINYKPGLALAFRARDCRKHGQLRYDRTETR